MLVFQLPHPLNYLENKLHKNYLFSYQSIELFHVSHSQISNFKTALSQYQSITQRHNLETKVSSSTTNQANYALVSPFKIKTIRTFQAYLQVHDKPLVVISASQPSAISQKRKKNLIAQMSKFITKSKNTPTTPI